MREIPTVILTVPLTLPLPLVNDIDAESRRLGKSIPDMLSSMLINAMAERQDAEFNDAAALNLMDLQLFTAPSGTPFPGTRPAASQSATPAVCQQCPFECDTCPTPAAPFPGVNVPHSNGSSAAVDSGSPGPAVGDRS